MKKLLIFLLLPLLLSGCSKPPITPTEPIAPPDPTEASGLYVPDSFLEQETGGAVKYYPLDDNTYTAIVPMGKDLLLQSRDNTRLTLLTGKNLSPAVQKQVSFHIRHLQCGSQSAAYIDGQAEALVFLTPALQESSRMKLPGDLQGTPWLSPDWSSLYYCTGTGLWCLDLGSGITRMLMAQTSDRQSVTGVFLNGTVVRCDIPREDGSTLTQMVSSTDGSILWEGTGLLEFASAEDIWFARADSTSVQELLFSSEGKIKNLWLSDAITGCIPLPEQNAVLAYREASWGTHLYYYDLNTGRCTASVRLKGLCLPQSICPDASGSGLWLLAQDRDMGTDVVCHWAPNASQSSDNTVYTHPHYTRDDPDSAGLQALQAQLPALEERYGIRLLIGSDGDIAPGTVSVQTEYLVNAYQRYLPILTSQLAQFPEGFFRQAAYRTNSGVIHIALVRSFQGAVADLPALLHRQDGELYLILAMDAAMEQNFYHGVSHIIETRLLSTTSALYGWEALNPAGFAYDNDYRKNQDRDESQFLQGKDRAFIDTFSMSFLREDRAQILQAACMPGNEQLFDAPVLQQKLQLLCTGIRKAFSLGDSTYIWEQYLTSPAK